MDETVDQKLDRCPDCGHSLSDEDSFASWEHYQEEIVPAQVRVTRYRHFRYRCPCCKKVQDAPAQGDEIPHSKLGPRILLATALYKYHFALPYNKIARMLNQTCGLKVTASALAQGVLRLAERFQGEMEALQAAIRASPAVNIDETGWRVEGINHWLWVFTDKIHTVYRIDRSRGSKVVKEQLGENFKGVVNSDFFSAYNPLPYAKQKCHVHLLRELHNLGERNRSAQFQWLRKKVERLLQDSVRLKEKRDKYDAALFQRRLNRLKQRALELDDVEYDDPDSARIAKRVAKHAGELFTFVENDAVDKDNNLAERMIRPNVLIRKVSAGNRSGKGADSHEILMSLITTCRQKGDEWFQYGKIVLNNQRDGFKEPVIISK